MDMSDRQQPPLPNFVVIGGSRSATHWINLCLAPHPDIYITPYANEVFFFDRYFDRGNDWYARYFRSHAGEKRIGEVTSTYLADPKAFERLHQTIPRASLIVSIRDPIARAFSKYLHKWRFGEIPPSFNFREACEAVPQILTDGEYGRHINRWLQLFEVGQLKIKLVDDITPDPLAYVRDLYEWLGVDPGFAPDQATRGAVNIHQTPRSLFLARHAFRVSEFLHSRGLHKLVEFVKRSGVRNIVLANKRDRSREPPPLSAADRRWLQDYFLSDVQSLSKIVNRDLVTLWFAKEGQRDIALETPAK